MDEILKTELDTLHPMTVSLCHSPCPCLPTICLTSTVRLEGVGEGEPLLSLKRKRKKKKSNQINPCSSFPLTSSVLYNYITKEVFLL